MKKLLFILLASVNVLFCYSQEVINLKYDSEKKEFSPETKKVKFKAGKTYQVKIHNVNTSFLSSKLESQSYVLSSSTPDIIKPIYPGISDIASIYKIFGITDSLISKGQLNEIYLKAIKDYNNLKALKMSSDSLYKLNDIEISKYKLKADSIKSVVYNIFWVDNFLDLKREVNLAINYIDVANEVFKVQMENVATDELIANKVIENYAELRYVLKSIQSENYLKYVKLIEKSLTPDTIVTSKPFKAEKDLVELNITLVDTYKPDTLYNSSVTFYTSGNLSFDFSTGFFYNNLHEESYYLEKRDTLVNNVLKNDNSTFDVSFGALGHLSYKITNYTKLGVSMGAALSPLDGKTRYLVGGSLVFGRNKQVGINGGWIFAKMKVLSNSVKNDELGNYVPISVTDVPTYDKIKGGFYLGITYNLTSQKKN